MADHEVIEGEEEFVALTKDYVRSKIRHTLKIYPKVSMSMLQVGIGTGIPPKFWKPVFSEMVNEGLISVKVIPYTTPTGRDMTYRVVQLAEAS